MATIHIICGKAGSGKDTLVAGLLNRYKEKFVFDIPYTSRPMRVGEKDGVNYFFRSFLWTPDGHDIVESRRYTVSGGKDWYYWHVKIKEESLPVPDVLSISTANTIEKYARAYGKENIRVYELVCSPNELLHRLIHREIKQKNPDYVEMVRRFTAEEGDWKNNLFNPEKVCERLDIPYHAIDGENSLNDNVAKMMELIFPTPDITLV